MAHPNTSKFSGARGCRINAAAASPVASIGVTRATASAMSMMMPIAGICLMSNGEKRIDRKSSQIASQIARQETDAVRNDGIAVLPAALGRSSGMFSALAINDTRQRMYSIRLCLSLLILPLLAAGCAQDPVRADPAPSANPPAAMEEISILSNGARMNGLLYLAAGAGPHPVVLFLHGYPGFERNLDLAQAVRRAGYDVVYFDYRGTWGSAGTFSYGHALEDVEAALSWIRAPSIAEKYHFDSTRISLIGHSFGGWLSLMTGARQPANVCVAAIAAENAGWDGSRFPDHPDERAEQLDYFRATTGEGAPIRATAEDVQDEIIQHAATWNYLTQANGLKAHALLLLSSTRDTPDEDVAMHKQLAEAVRSAGGPRVRNLVFDDDHPFSSHRVAVAETLVRWLRQDCAATQG